MTKKKYFIFTLSFWLITTMVLLVERYQVAQHHMDVAYVRHVYLCMIGILVSVAMTSIYNSEYFSRVPRKLVLLNIVCALAAIITALLLNPITYLMVGYNLQHVHLEIVSTGTLYFFLFYLLWSVLYFQLSERSLLIVKSKESAIENSADSIPQINVFKVEKLGEKRLLQDIDICCISANGDYVELITLDNRYMIKTTLRKLEEQLDCERFKRVHRSSIVNCDKIKSVVAKPGGAFEISLDGGHLILSSRSYKSVVEGILPEA